MESDENPRATAGSGVQDATMLDVGEKGRPPGEPPDDMRSWVDRVNGGSVGVLSRKLRELWKPKGEMYVMDLPRQFFMVRFTQEDEYMGALTGGPWRVFGNYLMVQNWTLAFDPLKDEIVTTPVWVRLLNIPVSFYHQSILMGIASSLGKPLKVDTTTLNFSRARFARVCVEVNLSRPLKGTVLINGEQYFVAYEGLDRICSSCGLYGHFVHSCPTRETEEALNISDKPVMSAVGDARQQRQTPPGTHEEGFTTVSQSRRPPARKPAETANVVISLDGVLERNLRDITGNPGLQTSNRFQNLITDTGSTEIREGTMSNATNKENESAPHNLYLEGSGGPARSEGKVGGGC
ncbi:PREDICTED: uncharacterized protein LOC104704363 [Camelina sativa]|uniref:Uncharacterized protein LOC104704363 n=1 Tax=Camelina sativa TaxID=90675 RepID=A0ABM1Q719_CAMSA|nr:PREDICTED: uncharacterized protein LOC104704363 [Camelina sativa]